MKKFIAMRLIVFIFLSMGIYFYMNNMLAMEAPEKVKIAVTKIAIEDSDKIWAAIEGLESSWRQQATSFKESLNRFGAKYAYLKENIDNLIKAQEEHNWDKFLYYKEIIMKELRSVWAEQTRQIQESLWQRFKNRTYNLWQRIYNYFYKSIY